MSKTEGPTPAGEAPRSIAYHDPMAYGFPGSYTSAPYSVTVSDGGGHLVGGPITTTATTVTQPQTSTGTTTTGTATPWPCVLEVFPTPGPNDVGDDGALIVRAHHAATRIRAS